MDDWNELDVLVRSTIKLNLAEISYFTMVNEKTIEDLSEEAICHV